MSIESVASNTKEEQEATLDPQRKKELDLLVNDPYMLTTLDNPFNPFIQYDDWYAFDVAHGYNSCAYLARIVQSSLELSEQDEALAVATAIDEIVKLDLLGIYVKVQEKTFVDRSETVVFPTVEVQSR